MNKGPCDHSVPHQTATCNIENVAFLEADKLTHIFFLLPSPSGAAPSSIPQPDLTPLQSSRMVPTPTTTSSPRAPTT